MEKSIFFVSTGRTGTHFLQSFFEENLTNTLSVWEPNPSFKRRSTELVLRPPNLFEKIYFSLPRKFQIYYSGCKYYVEANSSLYGCLPLIRKTFDNPQIIHIIRDGREVVKSFMNSFKRYAKDPHGGKKSQLSPNDFAKDPYQKQWENMNPVEKTAWFWLRVNEVIEQNKPEFTVFFEDLFKSPHKPLLKLLDDIFNVKLEHYKIQKAFKRKTHSTQGQFIPEWEHWPNLWKEQFEKICGEKMKEYEYEL
ncbi:MAG: sulfotransferase [Clostridiales bacterium]|nr:sulfotransferase [Clostridiales bacterium]